MLSGAAGRGKCEASSVRVLSCVLHLDFATSRSRVRAFRQQRGEINKLEINFQADVEGLLLLLLLLLLIGWMESCRLSKNRCDAV